MTTHLGTFIPLQTQSLGLGTHGLNQGFGFGTHGLNQTFGLGTHGLNQTFGLGTHGLNQSFGFGVNGLNPNVILGQTSSHNHHGGSVYLVPAFGTNQSEIVQGILPNGSAVAFIPNHNHISGGAFVPTNTTIQGLGNSTSLNFQGGNHLGGIALGNAGVSQSFATELFENNQEYVLSFDVPGIDIEDLDISLSGNTVYINGIRKDSREASTLAYSEIAKGNITRAISVPFDVSSNKAINTSLENGVLKIRIAKENQGDKRASARKVKIG